MKKNDLQNEVLVLPSITNTISLTVTYNPNLEDRRLLDQMENLYHNVHRIIIVDNASNNFKTLSDSISPYSDKVTLLRNETNLGMSGGLNCGIREFLQNTSAEWALLLDQDTIISDGDFKKMYEELKKINEKQYYMVGLNYWRLRFSKKILRNNGGIREAREVITSGSLVSRTILNRVKPDENLFMYFVDTDFCKKVRKKGFKIFLLKDTIMDHEEGKRKIKDGKEYYFIDMKSLYLIARNGILMLKRYGDITAVLFSLLTLYMNIIAISQPFMNVSSYLKGILDGLKTNNV